VTEGADRPAALRDLDGEAEDGSPVELAEALQGGEPARHGPWLDGGSNVAVDVLLIGPDVATGGARGPSEVVQAVDLAGLRLTDQHVAAAAAKAGHERLDDGEGRGDRDDGIDGVAAEHQGADAGLGGEAVGRADDAAHANGRRPECAVVWATRCRAELGWGNRHRHRRSPVWQASPEDALVWSFTPSSGYAISEAPGRVT
jgi:hypothetical protein